jgi:hypothetical protein
MTCVDVCANTIVDDYRSLGVAARPALGVCGPEAFEGRLLDGIELRGRRLGRVSP